MMTTSHFQSGSNNVSSPAKTKVYASVAEMKRSKGKVRIPSLNYVLTFKKKSFYFQSSTRVRFLNSFKRMGELHRDFHSTPDLAHQLGQPEGIVSKGHRSQEDVTLLGSLRPPLPPPSHPPPPPPIGQMVMVDISRGSKFEYDIVTYKGKHNRLVIFFANRCNYLC